MKITKAELKKIIGEELKQLSEYGWNDLKVGDSVTLKNNKKAKVVKLGGKGKGFPRNFVKVKPSSGKEEVVLIDDLKESKQVSEAKPQDLKKAKQKLNETMNKRQGAEVIQQLGGGRFIAMTGAKDFFIGPKGVVFKIGRNSKGVNYVRINLNSMDTYDVEFLSVRNYKEKVKSTAKGIYADMLRDVFEQHTGLRTSL
tara:strand:+ start:81374 stop:81967 length:594 start_codon:yes stop_codon:yes gene_type:complete